jgi:hypothetical protein
MDKLFRGKQTMHIERTYVTNFVDNLEANRCHDGAAQAKVFAHH